ncbi:MAG: esterase-like activity of phytase family protein [Pseudomonadota bacterium]
MTLCVPRLLTAGIATAAIWTAAPVLAQGGDSSFKRVATLGNYLNTGVLDVETVSEIVAATANGLTLVYTDGENDQIGFVDIADPSSPTPGGTLAVSGEPTSVAVLGDTLALVATNTSEDFINTSGNLDVIDIVTRRVIRVIPLGGQPDSIAISPDGQYAAIAIENERDEEIFVDEVEGGLPQLPAGFLAIVDLQGAVEQWAVRTADLTGLSAYAPTDPEPEFVDINARNLAAVSLQENNHVAIVDLATGMVTGDFDMGAVTLEGVDATEDGVIELAETLVDVVREPDAITWLPRDRIGTANEGDLFGGSRGFTVFEADGSVVFDAGTAYEELAVRFGHYPEERSENKGSEPEAIEFGRFGDTNFLFVGSERGSFIGVYQLTRNGRPLFRQLLPGPLGPEGLLAIPSRNLLVVSGEEDDPSFGVRSSIMIYALSEGAPTYPQLLSFNDAAGSPIAWSAMSGMVAAEGSRLLAVWDSFYSESKIFTIGAGTPTARVIDAVTIQGGSGDFDPEGIAIAPDGTYWIASEGDASGSRLNRLLQVDVGGNLISEITLPAQIEACRAASENRASLGGGFEGVASLGTDPNNYRLLVAQQRGWDYTTPECEALDDDPKDANEGEPAFTRLWLYRPSTDTWSAVPWELAPVPEDAAWVGLSEISVAPDGDLVLIERDNRTGDFAQLKTLVRVGLRGALDGVSSQEKEVYDLLPDLTDGNGWITDKPEGVAITRNGQVFLVSDNDGVDDWSGETSFLSLGTVDDLFSDEVGLFVDFESGEADFINFAGGVSNVVPNPLANPSNPSAFTAEMQKFAAEVFGGSTLALGEPFPLSDGAFFRMKVLAARQVDVLFKLEFLNFERTETYSGSGDWEELCFSFEGISGDVTDITVIFDLGILGDADNDPVNWTFQYDDIEQSNQACADRA